MKNIYPSLFYGYLLTSLTSCYSPTFIPQTHNVPLFTEKQELKANATINSKSLDLQVAYSPINYIGVLANAQFYKTRIHPEIAAGGFYCFNDKLVTELYLGYGTARIKHETKRHSAAILGKVDDLEYNVDINAYKLFIQPDIGIKFNDDVNLSLSLKTTYWTFTNYYYHFEKWKYDNYGGQHRTLEHMDSINVKNDHQTTFEPALTLRCGNDVTKFMMQLGVAYNTRPLGSLDPYIDAPIFFRIGVNISIDLNREKRVKEKQASKEVHQNIIK